MKSLELQPTSENIKTMFIRNLIGRNEDIFAFIEMLSTLEENYSIALDGQWGSGKTFFVKQMIMLIDATYGALHSEYTKTEQENILSLLPPEHVGFAKKNFAIYFDAWENDNDDDPLLSLIYTISEKYGVNSPNIRNTTDIFFDVASVLTSSPITSLLTGGILGARTPEKIEKLKSSIKGVDLLESIKNTKDIKGRIDAFFNSLVEGKESERIVIFIDELDRCKPSYAVKLLERIKHYMTHPNITFVFSTNLSELSCTVKKCYGTDFNGQKYLEKMFSDIYTLPHLTTDQIHRLTHFERNSAQEFIVSLFCKKYNTSLRERLKMLTKVRVFVKKHCGKYSYVTPEIKFYLALEKYIIPFFICLRVYNNKTYDACLHGLGKETFLDFFTSEKVRSRLQAFFLDDGQGDDEKFLELLSEFYEAVFLSTNQNDSFSCHTIGTLEVQETAKETIIFHVNA